MPKHCQVIFVIRQIWVGWQKSERVTFAKEIRMVKSLFTFVYFSIHE